LTDRELMDRFLADREEVAFESLVRRHGPMVLGVCRRVLANRHDAEDAFQATFLVLVRRAAAVIPRDLVGPWLYGVAYRTALEARRMRTRRMVREGQSTPRPGRRTVSDEAADREGLERLDRELARLPDRYRVPVILCDLEGKTHREAARLLDCPEATLSTRLRRGRQLLARRMGTALAGGVSAGVLFEGMTRAEVPAPLMIGTARMAVTVAAGSPIAAVTSGHVAVLTEGVLKTMFHNRLSTIVALVPVLGLVALGAGLLPGWARWLEPPAAAAEPRILKDGIAADGPAENLRRLEAVKWHLLRIDKDKHTLHVADTPAERSWGRHAAESMLASAGAQLSLVGVPVAPNAKVKLDGKEIPFKELTDGVNLTLKFDADKAIVSGIEATTPPSAGYVVTAVDADQNVITVRLGKDDKPMVLPVVRDGPLSIGTLKDLKPDTRVRLHLEVADGKLVVKDLRTR
jgi:RNA polymerase sigma-70 factor (ECF subfamily)